MRNHASSLFDSREEPVRPIATIGFVAFNGSFLQALFQHRIIPKDEVL